MNLAAPAVSNRLQLGRFQPIRVTISAKEKGRNARNLSAGTEVICVIGNELWPPPSPHDSLTRLSGTECATVASQVDLRNLSAWPRAEAIVIIP